MADKLSDRIREYRIEKEKRYGQFRVLLTAAIAAGEQAAAGSWPDKQRRRGPVWVRLVDGRSSFRRFIIEDEIPGWKRGSREMGVFLDVDFRQFDKSMAYARAFAGVLCAGGVAVTVEYRLITEGNG